MKKFLQNPFFSGSLILIVGSMSANVVNYLFHLVIGRMLGPIDYGVLASLFSLLYMLSIVPSSSSFAIVKYISASNQDEIPYVFFKINKLVKYISYVLCIVLLILSPFIMQFLHIDNLLNILIIVPLLYLIINTILYQATLQGLLIFWGQTLPLIVSSTGKLVLSVFFVFIGLNVFGAMLGVLLSAYLAFMLVVWIGRKKISSTYVLKKQYNFKIKDFIFYGSSVFVNAISFTSIFTVDLILAKHFLSSYDAGLYAALSTLGKVIFFATQPVTSAMFPIVVKKKFNGENYKIIFSLAFLLTMFISFSAVFIYYFFPKVTILILFGKEYLDVSSSLFMMGLFISMYSLCYYLANYLLSIGKTKVVYIPSFFAILQIILIVKYHSSIYQIVNLSFYLMTIMFVILSYFLYKNEFINK